MANGSVLFVTVLANELEQIEQDSKKGNRKWHHADYRYRRDYIERISQLAELEHKIFFKKFPKPKKYLEFTATATADALRQRRSDRVVVYIDGLPKGQIPAFKRQLKPSVKRPTKVRGVRKEENKTEPFATPRQRPRGILGEWYQGRFVSRVAASAVRLRSDNGKIMGSATIFPYQPWIMGSATKDNGVSHHFSISTLIHKHKDKNEYWRLATAIRHMGGVLR